MANKSSDHPTQKTVAQDLKDYLQNTAGVCAKGNVHGWRWIRYTDGEWQAVKYGGEHRCKEYVHGEILRDGQVLNWLISKPVQIIPSSEAYLWGPKDETVWEDADIQDVFTITQRCFYCGQSEATTTLKLYETTEQGKCRFCSECHQAWRDAGEIVKGPIQPDWLPRK